MSIKVPSLQDPIIEKIKSPAQTIGKTTADVLINNNIQLIQAVKNDDVFTMIALVKQGADPFFKDQINCTAIDYAIYGSHQDYLPMLLGKEVKKIELNLFERLTSTVNLAKDYQEIFKEMGKLSGKKELKFANVDQLKERLLALHQEVLNSNGNFHFKEVYKNYIILAACYATPEVLTELIEKGISFDKFLDVSGRSLLHYTAVLAPKNFHILVQHGLNLNQPSINKASPTDLLIADIQSKDPINVGILSISVVYKAAMLAFALAVLPTMLTSYESNVYETIETLYFVNVAYAVIQAISTQFEIALNIVKNPTVANLKSVLPQLTPYLWMLPAIAAPIGILPLNILNISWLAVNTFKGLKAAWQHSSYRPFKATLAALVHSANMSVSFVNIINSTLRALDDPFNEKSHQRREETENEYSKRHQWYSDYRKREYEKRQHTYEERQQDDDNFWENFNRFNGGDYSNSGSSYSGFALSYTNVRDSLKRILTINNSQDCKIIESAKTGVCATALQQLQEVTSAEAMEIACKKLRVMFHPDKFAQLGSDVKEAAGRIFAEFNGAKSGNCDSKMA